MIPDTTRDELHIPVEEETLYYQSSACTWFHWMCTVKESLNPLLYEIRTPVNDHQVSNRVYIRSVSKLYRMTTRIILTAFYTARRARISKKWRNSDTLIAMTQDIITSIQYTFLLYLCIMYPLSRMTIS